MRRILLTLVFGMLLVSNMLARWTQFDGLIEQSQVIFVGRVISLGANQPESPDAVIQPGVKVRVLRVLKGKIEETAVVSLRLQKSRVGQVMPTLGGSFIFFATTPPPPQQDPLTNVFILPASDDQILNTIQEIGFVQNSGPIHQ